MLLRRVVRVVCCVLAVALLSQLVVWGDVSAVAVAGEPVAVVPVAAPVAVVPVAGFGGGSVLGPTVLSDYRLAVDETWGPEGSPYVLRGQLTVLPGVSLTLLPGTVVKFDGQTSRMVVYGQLLSLGRPDRRVVVTSVKDDAVAGDTNGDGDASVPARGDWWSLRFRQYDASSPRLGSVIDYTDIRYGDYGSAIFCQTGMVDVDGGVPVTITNSSLTDARISPLILGGTVDAAPVGIYNNTFARSSCGLTSYLSQADIVGNTFEDSLWRAAYISYPKRVGFWFNTLRSQPVVNGNAPTRAEADVRYNSFLAGIYHWYPGSQDLQDWSGNWFGVDPRAPLPRCVAKANADAWIPAINYVTSSSCPGGQVAPSGYRGDVSKLMTAAPLPVPASVVDALSPRVGPVDTRTGVLSYSVTDLVVRDAGKELSATRLFRSDRVGSGPGYGWSGSYGEAVSGDGVGRAVLGLADGSTLPFRTDPQVGYVPAQGVGVAFSAGTSGTTITTVDRTSYQFSAAGELDSVLMQDLDHQVKVRHVDGQVSVVEGVSGRKIWFDRDAGRLTVVRDSVGRRAEFSYADNRLSSVLGVDGQSETYSYDSEGRLTQVRAPSGLVRLAAGYDGRGRVSWLEQHGAGRLEFVYDSDARRTTIRYADGHTLVQQYDDLGRLVAETVGSTSRHLVYDAEGRKVVDIGGVPSRAMRGYSALATGTFYNHRGNQVWQSDPSGVWAATTFSSDHQPLVTTYSDGGKIGRSYDGDNRLVSITDQVGGEYRYTYGRFGQVKTQTDPLGRTRSFSYAENGDLVTSTDEYGATTRYATDDRGKVTQITDAEGGVYATSFTSFDAVSQTTSPGGGGVTVGYDVDRRVTSLTRKLSATETATTSYEYDSRGQLRAVVDASGGRHTTEYNQLGLLVKTTDAAGGVTRQAYTDEGWLASSTDPLGGVTLYEHDPGGRDYRVTDPLGQVTQTVWDRAGRPAAVWTPAGGKTTISYDRAGRQAVVVTPLGKRWTTTYDMAGRPTGWRDPLGNTRAATYDLVGRQLSYTNELGEVVTTSYDDANHRTTISDAIGVREQTTLNTRGQVAAHRDPGGGLTRYVYNSDGLPTSVDGSAGTVRTSYDLAGRVISSTDPAGRATSYRYDTLGRVTARELAGTTTRFEYDPLGRVTKQTDAEGRPTQYSYNPAGNLVGTIDGLNHVTSYDYDALGRLVRTTDPTGVTTNRAYDPVGRPAVTWDGLGASWVTSYDLDGNIATTVDPAGVTHTYSYDDMGRMLSDRNDVAYFTYTWDKAGRLLTTSNLYKTSYTYDVRGRVTSTTNGVGKKTTTGYTTTDDGQVITRTTPAGNTTTITIDQAGRIRSTTDPTGARVALGWTPDSKLEQVALPLGGTYQYRYDNRGNLASETNPLDAKTRFSYDNTGLLTGVEYPSGRVIEHDYDQATRLVSSTANQSGSQPDNRKYSYDDAGRLTQATTSGPSGHTVASWRYNSRGLLANATTSQGDISYGYDLAHRARTVTGMTGQTATFGYDPRGYPATVRGPLNLNLTYNNAGQLARREPVSPTAGIFESRRYDDAGRPISIDGEITHSLAYTDDGLVAADRNSTGTTRYTYDAAGRLTQETFTHSTTSVSTTTGYTWDSDGNRSTVVAGDGRTTSYTYNAADQLVADSQNASYSTDPDGLATVQGDVRLSYNAFAELVGTSKSSHATSYVRDGLGRVASQTNDHATASLVYHGLGIALAGYVANSGSRVDVQTAPDGTLLGYVPAAGNSQLVRTNTHGDVEKVLTGRTTISHATYDAFGNTTTSSGAALVPLGYQSALADTTSGLITMGARSYNPTLGRFTQADTITGAPAIATSFNRYVYAFGSPTNLVDPTGRWPDWLNQLASEASSMFKDAVGALGKAVSAAGETLTQVGGAVQSVAKQAARVVVGAAKWVHDNREELGMVAASIAADVAVTGACGVLTAGVGSIGCMAAGGFVGGAVYGALKCPHNSDRAQCLLDNSVAGLGFGIAGGIAGKLLSKAFQATKTRISSLTNHLDDAPAASAIKRIIGATDEGTSSVAAEQRTARSITTKPTNTTTPTPNTTKPVRFGPMNPGPLPDEVASTFRSSSYTMSGLSEATTLYRVYGGKAGQLGSYWSRVKPSGPLQAQLDSALNPAWGNSATSVATTRVPAGTTIYEGAAASQPIGGGGSLLGGGSQVYIPRVDSSWLVPS